MLNRLIVFVISGILCVFCGIKFGLLSKNGYEFETSLNTLNFCLWLLSTIFIAVGALLYKDNDKGTRAFAFFNFLGIAIAYVIAYLIGNFSLGTLVLIISVLLFVSLSQLKNQGILRILCFSLCCSLYVIFYGVMELVSFIKQNPEGIQRLIFSIITDYSIFIFFLSAALFLIFDIREVTKQHNNGIETIDHLVGFRISILIIGVMLISIAFGYSYYLYSYLYQNTAGLVVGLLCVLAPLIIAAIKCFSIEKKESKLVFSLTQISLIGSSLVLMVFYFST